MTSGHQEQSIGDAASRFLAKLSAEERTSSQQEVNKFVRWFGRERAFAGLAAAEVANYAERLSTSAIDYIKKLELLRAFLVYAKKEGLSKTNLAVHLKARKGKSNPRPSVQQSSAEAVFLTRQGYTNLEAELAALQGKREEAIDAIRKAAADKDFRENAPLQAAREQRGLLEGRIMELEAALKEAVIVDDKKDSTHKIGIGDSIVLNDLNSGQEVRYTLVGSREVEPAKGKISGASPVGQAVIGRGEGEIVEIAVPAGKRRYQIKQIEH